MVILPSFGERYLSTVLFNNLYSKVTLGHTVRRHTRLRTCADRQGSVHDEVLYAFIFSNVCSVTAEMHAFKANCLALCCLYSQQVQAHWHTYALTSDKCFLLLLLHFPVLLPQTPQAHNFFRCVKEAGVSACSSCSTLAASSAYNCFGITTSFLCLHKTLVANASSPITAPLQISQDSWKCKLDRDTFGQVSNRHFVTCDM